MLTSVSGDFVRVLSSGTSYTHPLIKDYVGAAALAARVLTIRGRKRTGFLLVDVDPLETPSFSARTPPFVCYYKIEAA